MTSHEKPFLGVLLLVSILTACGGKSGSARTETCGGETISLGPDQTTHPRGGALQVDATVTGPDNPYLLTYDWTITAPDGSEVSPVVPNSNGLPKGTGWTEVAFWVDQVGTYTVGVNITSLGCQKPATTHITVTDAPPVADAGPDQTIAKTDPVELDGSGSTDPDGDYLTYSWAFVSQPPGSTVSIVESSSRFPRQVDALAGASNHLNFAGASTFVTIAFRRGKTARWVRRSTSTGSSFRSKIPINRLKLAFCHLDGFLYRKTCPASRRMT